MAAYIRFGEVVANCSSYSRRIYLILLTFTICLGCCRQSSTRLLQLLLYSGEYNGMRAFSRLLCTSFANPLLVFAKQLVISRIIRPFSQCDHCFLVVVATRNLLRLHLASPGCPRTLEKILILGTDRTRAEAFKLLRLHPNPPTPQSDGLG